MKRIIIAIVALVVLGVGGTLIWRATHTTATADKTIYKIAKAEIGTVKKTISATGVLQPWTVVDLKSKAGGMVEALMVDVGSRVTKGQILARIDPSDTLMSVNTARADVQSAQARERQSLETLGLQRQQTTIAIQSARAQIASSEASYEAAKARLQTARNASEAQPALTASALKQARANLEAAEYARRLLDSTQAQDRASAQSALDQAIANRQNSEANLARQRSLFEKGYASKQAVDSAQASYAVSAAQVSAAQEKVSTQAAQQTADLQASDARVKQARAQLETAETQKVEIQNRANSLAEAVAAEKQAASQLNQVRTTLAGALAARANDKIRGFDVATANATIARSQATLTNANITLNQTTVTAPADGVILKKYVEQGTIISSALSFAASGNNILQMGDTTRMYVDVTVDETDIASVDEGQQVDVTCEAYPNLALEGKVARIDPQAVVEQNVTNVHVRVEIDNSSPTFALLKPGMNATCEFVRGRKESVVCVPNDAVRTDDKGRYLEVTNGTGRQAPPDAKTGQASDPDMLVGVKVERRDLPEGGLEGNETTEIPTGLREGEIVVVQRIEPVTTPSGSPFGGGGLPGGRGMGGGRGR